MFKLSFLTIGLVLGLISGEEQSSLVFSNNPQLKNEKSSPKIQTLGGQNSLQLPQVINLLNDNTTTLVNSTKSINNGKRRKFKAAKARILSPKFDPQDFYPTSNPDTIEDDEYEGGEDEADWNELEKLQNSNGAQNGPIYPQTQNPNNLMIATGDLQPSGPSIQHIVFKQKPDAPANSTNAKEKNKDEFNYENKYEPHLLSEYEQYDDPTNAPTESNDSNDLSSEYEQYDDPTNAPTESNDSNDLSSEYEQYDDPTNPTIEFEQYYTETPSSLETTQSPQFITADRQPQSLQQIAYQENNLTDQPIANKNIKGKIPYDDEYDEKKENPVDPTSNTKQYVTERSNSLDDTHEQGTQYSTVEQYTTALPIPQSSYISVQEPLSESLDIDIEKSVTESDYIYTEKSVTESAFIHTAKSGFESEHHEKPNNVHKPLENNTQADYLEQAKNLSIKLGYEDTSETSEIKKLEDTNDLIKEDIHGTREDTNVIEDGLAYPSVYQIFKSNMEQTQTTLNTTSRKNDVKSTSQPQSEVPKAKNKVVNLSPKIVLARLQNSFPSVDLFRRKCAIKINGFPALGICRPSCGIKEIGIQVKLDDKCTGYQLACNSPFELCCLPNLSEPSICGIDLFEPNEILGRIEKSLNLPESALLKLTQLPPPLIESVLNYRPFFNAPGQPFIGRFQNYFNLGPKPLILQNNIVKKSSQNQTHDDSLTYSTKIENEQIQNKQYRSVSNPPMQKEVKFIKVLRRVDNPKPASLVKQNITSIYHGHYNHK